MVVAEEFKLTKFLFSGLHMNLTPSTLFCSLYLTTSVHILISPNPESLLD